MFVCLSVHHTCYYCTGLLKDSWGTSALLKDFWRTFSLQNLLVYKSQPPGLRDLWNLAQFKKCWVQSKETINCIHRLCHWPQWSAWLQLTCLQREFLEILHPTDFSHSWALLFCTVEEVQTWLRISSDSVCTLLIDNCQEKQITSNYTNAVWSGLERMGLVKEEFRFVSQSRPLFNRGI